MKFKSWKLSLPEDGSRPKAEEMSLKIKLIKEQIQQVNRLKIVEVFCWLIAAAIALRGVLGFNF